jgi:hypothetical protein
MSLSCPLDRLRVRALTLGIWKLPRLEQLVLDLRALATASYDRPSLHQRSPRHLPSGSSRNFSLNSLSQ